MDVHLAMEHHEHTCDIFMMFVPLHPLAFCVQLEENKESGMLCITPMRVTCVMEYVKPCDPVSRKHSAPIKCMEFWNDR